jgi:hypothetical protein
LVFGDFKIRVAAEAAVPYATINITEETKVTMIGVTSQPSTRGCILNDVAGIDPKFYKSVFAGLGGKEWRFLRQCSRRGAYFVFDRDDRRWGTDIEF